MSIDSKNSNRTCANKTDCNDSYLITQALSGDKQAYNILVQNHQRALRNFIASRSQYFSDVDDIAQECFIIAYQKLAELEKHENLRSWLCGIALNLVRNHHRKFNPTAASNENELSQLITSQLETQVTKSEEQVSLSALKACMKALNDENQHLIALHYQQSLPVKTLVQQLNIKHSTLTMRLHRIRLALQKCISDKIARDHS